MSNPITKFSAALGLTLLGLALLLCALPFARGSVFSGCDGTPSPRTDQVTLATEESASEQDAAVVEDDDILADLPDSRPSLAAHRFFKGVAQSNCMPENPGHALRDRSSPVSRA
jgi:hypothetical protein